MNCYHHFTIEERACLRKYYMHIICLYGFMGKHATIDEGIKQAVETCNDDKVVYLENGFIQDGLEANSHPSKNAQKEWADILAEYIQSNILGE